MKTNNAATANTITLTRNPVSAYEAPKPVTAADAVIKITSTMTLTQLKRLVKDALIEDAKDPGYGYITIFEKEDEDIFWWTYLAREGEKLHVCAVKEIYQGNSVTPDHYEAESRHIITKEDQLTEADLNIATYWL